MPTFPAHLIGTDFRDCYAIHCPKCKKPFYARPSLLMTAFGINQGGGSCSDCKTVFHLGIGDDGEMHTALECSDLECRIEPAPEHAVAPTGVCDTCANERGATFPEGHLASCWIGPCQFCGEQKEVCSYSDWTWPRETVKEEKS